MSLSWPTSRSGARAGGPRPSGVLGHQRRYGDARLSRRARLSLPRDETLGAHGQFRVPVHVRLQRRRNGRGLTERRGEGERVFAFPPAPDPLRRLGRRRRTHRRVRPAHRDALPARGDSASDLARRRRPLPRGCGRPRARPGRNPHRDPSWSGATVLGSDPKPWRRETAQVCGLEAVEPEALGDAVRLRHAGVARTSSSRRRGIRKRSARASGSSRRRASRSSLPGTARSRSRSRSGPISTAGVSRFEAARSRRSAAGPSGGIGGGGSRRHKPCSQSSTPPSPRTPSRWSARRRLRARPTGDDGVVHVALAYS